MIDLFMKGLIKVERKGNLNDLNLIIMIYIMYLKK